MNCRECRDELELWVGLSELPNDLRDHLAGCAECRGYWEELTGLAASMADDRDFELTATEVSAIEAGINRRIGAEQVTTITSLNWLRYAAVAASVIIVAGIGLTGYRANWFGNRAGTVDTMMVAQADTQTGAAGVYDLGGLDEEDYTILERAIDLTVQLDDASVLDNLSDEQIEYLESNLDVKGLI